MKNQKSTKKALLSSVLSLAICLTMLIGTTFAWFTDSVTSTGNIIKSGSLKVELNYKNKLADNWSKVTDQEEAIFNYNKWEPGYVDVKYIQVANVGNLAFKYLLNIIPKTAVVAGDVNLADVIDVYITEITETSTELTRESLGSMKKVGTLANLMTDLDGAARGILLPKEGSQNVTLAEEDKALTKTGEVTLGIALKMQESAGNEYQDKTVGGGFDIQLLATQYTWENDSFNNQYDKEATYHVLANSATELADALTNAKAGTVVTLAESVDYGTVTVGELEDVVIKGADDAGIIFKTDANTNIQNVTLQDIDFKYTGATVDCGVVLDANAQIDNLVIDGCSFTGTGAKAGRGLSGVNNNASIVLKNCTFKDLGYPIYAWGGYDSLTIEDCTFDNIKSWAIMPQSGFDGDLTVNNCKFVNCLGGGLIKAGTLTAGHTFTFTNNTIAGCTIAGDHNWFQFKVSAGITVISNNTMDGQPWTPTETDGLK